MKEKAPQIPINDVHSAARNPLISGKDINMGGLEWRVSALTLRHMEALQNGLEIAGNDQKKQFKVNLEAILWALQRNYPALTLEHILDLIDSSNYVDVLSAVMGVSGAILGNVSKPAGEPLT